MFKLETKNQNLKISTDTVSGTFHTKNILMENRKMSESGTRVNTQRFYGEYHGHKVGHLKIVHDKMRAGEKDSIVFLAGDLSLIHI